MLTCGEIKTPEIQVIKKDPLINQQNKINRMSSENNVNAMNNEQSRLQSQIQYFVENSDVLLLSRNHENICSDVIAYLDTCNQPLTVRQTIALGCVINCSCGFSLNVRPYRSVCPQGWDLRMFKSKFITPEDYEKYGLMSLFFSMNSDVRLMDREDFQNDILSLDRLGCLPVTLCILAKIVARLKYHSGKMTSRAFHFTRSRYDSWFTSFYQQCSLQTVRPEIVRMALDVCPNKEMNQALQQYDRFYRIHFLTTPQLAYIMGLPLINDYDRNDLTVRMLAICENENTINNHVNAIIQRNRDSLNDLSRTLPVVLPEVMNTEDLQMETIENYFPHDIIRYVDRQGHVFQYSRVDLPHIIKTGKNPVTNTGLPKSFCIEAAKILENAKYYKLPSPTMTVLGLLNNITTQVDVMETPKAVRENPEMNNDTMRSRAYGISSLMNLFQMCMLANSYYDENQIDESDDDDSDDDDSDDDDSDDESDDSDDENDESDDDQNNENDENNHHNQKNNNDEGISQ